MTLRVGSELYHTNTCSLGLVVAVAELHNSEYGDPTLYYRVAWLNSPASHYNPNNDIIYSDYPVSSPLVKVWRRAYLRLLKSVRSSAKL